MSPVAELILRDGHSNLADTTDIEQYADYLRRTGYWSREHDDALDRYAAAKAIEHGAERTTAAIEEATSIQLELNKLVIHEAIERARLKLRNENELSTAQQYAVTCYVNLLLIEAGLV